MATAQKVQEVRNISPAQRAQFFAQMTRQHLQMRPAVAGAENSVVSFNLDKVRLTSRILLLIEGTVTATHDSATSYTPAAFAPFSFLRSVNVEINNGFKPFTVSGREIYWYNLARDNANQIVPVYDSTTGNAPGRNRNYLGTKAAASPGFANSMKMIVELPLTLNERDPIGLILTQNEETVVTVSVTFGASSDLQVSGGAVTLAVSNLTVTPMVETFSIPPVKEAFPDISILKLVQSTKDAINGAGLYTLKLPVGLTYRKLLIFIEDSNGGVADTAFSGNFELILNGADYPYQVAPKVLAAINQVQYNQALPQGLYVFDFSYQGLANYGGARDYIDTERLTEFWFRFNATAAGYVTAVYELLSRLRAA